MFNLNEWISTHRFGRNNDRCPDLVCADGFSMSVQASRTHYCAPMSSSPEVNQYTLVEVGYPSQPEPSLEPFGERRTDEDGKDAGLTGIYAWVPVEVAEAIVIAHGGPRQ